MTMRSWPISTRGAAPFLIVAVSSAVLCSCSAIVDPYIIPTETGTNDAIPVSSSFKDAVDYARHTAKKMEERLSELEHYDIGTGLLISASGLTGLGLAAFGAHSDALVGAGLAGGAAFGARSYLPIQDRKVIYARGANAITCAITALSFGLPKDATNAIPNSVSLSTAPASAALVDMRNLVSKGFVELSVGLANPKDALSPIIQMEGVPSLSMGARLAVKRIDALERSRERTKKLAQKFTAEAESVINARGEKLVAATEAIRHVVNAQLIEARVDPDAAMEALQTKSEEHANSLRESYEKLHDAAQGTKDEAEATVSLGEEVEAEAQILGRVNKALSALGGETYSAENAITDATNAEAALAAAGKEITAQIDDMIFNAAQIFEIVGLKSTCANPSRKNSDD